MLLCGPNGSGKSSLFEAMKSWQTLAGPGSLDRDPEYLYKGGLADKGPDARQRIDVEFHEPTPNEAAVPRAMYFRTAYRNEPSFKVQAISFSPSVAGPEPQWMISNDSRVSDNYQRLAGEAFDALFASPGQGVLATDLVNALVGRLSSALSTVLPELTLTGMGNPKEGGTFRFAKGVISDFPYMNLSGGEKAVFDLLLDLSVKSQSYGDAVIWIDEPEAHASPHVHARLLDAMLALAGHDAQLCMATHSLSMLRRAQRLHDDEPGAVAFLDFTDRDFDEPQQLSPVALSRTFWKGLVATSLGEIADLVAPSTLVLCEGQPSTGVRSEFDPRCLRAIFDDHVPDVDFVAIGGDRQVIADDWGVGRAVQTVLPGAKIIPLIDRDDRSDGEVERLRSGGIAVLGRRNLESYLLDEEVLRTYCESRGQLDKWEAVRAERTTAMQTAIAGGKPQDDWKAAKGDIYNACKRILGLQRAGSNADEFMRTELAPLIRPPMAIYAELHADVFGAPPAVAPVAPAHPPAQTDADRA
jgi:hypothetical protein